MADDDKKAPENPKGRDKEADDRLNKQLTQSKTTAKTQEKKQDILAKKAEVLNKITQAAASNSDTKDKSNRKIFEEIEDILDNNNVGSKVYLDQLSKLEDLESSLDTQIKTGEKMIENDNVVRTLEDLIEENKRTTQVLEADSTAQLELQNQLKSLNGRFSGLDESGRANAALLQQQFEESSQALKDAIESGDTQAQDLAMKQLEQIKAGAESEENRREAQKANEIANSRLGQIAFAAEKTAEGMEEAIGGALAGAGVLAGLAGFALLFLNPEAFQEIMEKLIDQVGGVVDLITGIITGDFSMVMSGLGDSWVLLSGVALALLPKVIGFIGKILKAIKVFQIFMMKTFIPGILSMYNSMITSFPAGIKKVVTIAKAFKVYFLKTFIPGVINMFRSLIASFPAGLNKLVTIAKGFRVFMLGTFIPGMISAFTGMLASMAPIMLAMAPILIPILAIAALFGLIYAGLAAMRDAMGFTSIFDVIMLGFAYLKDAFAHIVNAVGSIVNFILNMVEGVAGIFGFEIDLPKIPKMATDNAEKKKAEIKVKKAALDAEKIQKEEMSGDAMNSQSFDNALEKANQGGGDAVVTSVQRDGDNITSVVTTTTISNPFSRASSVMEGVTSR